MLKSFEFEDMPNTFSFSQITSIPQANQRLIATQGGFKIAGGTSWLGRVINWVRETFFPASVKQENAAAYTAARDAWKVANADLATRDSTSFQAQVTAFEEKIRAGAPLTARHLNAMPIKVSSFSEATQGHVAANLADLLANSVSARLESCGANPPKQLDFEMIRDIGRSKYAIAGTMLPENRDGFADKMSAKFGDRMTTALTHVAHQGCLMPIMRGLIEESPLTDQHGKAVPYYGSNNQSTSYDFVPQDDGSVRVAVTCVFQQDLDPEETVAVAQMQKDSRFDVDFSFVLKPPAVAGGAYAITDVTRPVCRSQIKGWLMPPEQTAGYASLGG